MPLFALQRLGIRFEHVFSSDCSAACKKVIINTQKPLRFYDNVEIPKAPADKTYLYIFGPLVNHTAPQGRT